jgi:hypothetical protein
MSAHRGTSEHSHPYVEASMDKTVADMNIEYFKKLLETETDPVKRQTIQRLLAEEETKLALALAKKTESNLMNSGQDANASGSR